MKLPNKKHCYILGISTALYILIVFGLSWFKYNLFLYNGLDLAIFNNVFFNLINTGSFFSSIQGHTYLADHITPIISVLLPFYGLWQHPLNLLLMQTIVFGATSFIVYYLATTFLKHQLPERSTQFKQLPLWLALAWLINPLVWNANLFEFHLLIFAPATLMLGIIFYIQNQYKYFIYAIIASVLVREDVALLVMMFGVLAWIDKKPFKYRVTPIIIGGVYASLALVLSSSLTPDSFRFAQYYSWLGETPLEIISNFFTQPTLWLSHIFSIDNLDMLVGLLFPFVFVPLKRPKYLLLSLLPLAQFVLGRAGGSNLVVQTHYAVLFLPALIWATLDAITYIIQNKKSRWHKLFIFDTGVSKIVLSTYLILTFVALSPLGGIAYAHIIEAKPLPRVEVEHTILKHIAPESVLISTYDMLPHLSSRTWLYSSHYIFLGTQQFSKQPYDMPELARGIVFDTDDLLTYWLQISLVPTKFQFYHEKIKNLQTVLNHYNVTVLPNGLTVWQLHDEVKTPFHSSLFPESAKPLCDIAVKQENYHLTCTIIEPDSRVFFLRLTDAASTTRIIPFVWRVYDETSTHHTAYADILLPKNNWQPPFTVETVMLKGQVELGPWLTIENNIYQEWSYATSSIDLIQE